MQANPVSLPEVESCNSEMVQLHILFSSVCRVEFKLVQGSKTLTLHWIRMNHALEVTAKEKAFGFALFATETPCLLPRSFVARSIAVSRPHTLSRFLSKHWARIKSHFQ